VTIHVVERLTPSTTWVPFALIALALVPATAGSLRLAEGRGCCCLVIFIQWDPRGSCS
jgi:hypothetical protein